MTHRAVTPLLVLLVALPASAASGPAHPRAGLSFGERLAAQRAIEEVHWRHRIWPKDNPASKPSLDSMMPESRLRAKVEDYLEKSNALEVWWRRPIRGEQLQAELDRMARGSRDPRMLQELFAALGNDPFVIAETLARPALAERLVRNAYANDERFQAATPTLAERSFDAWWESERGNLRTDIRSAAMRYTLPALATTGCTDGTWTPTLTDVPDRRSFHTAVWTGTEMIVWGGTSFGYGLNTGGRYDPATDTWTPTSTGANAPPSLTGHAAIWTGTEMIVWGGEHRDEVTGANVFPTRGARYDPASDTWTPTSTGANTPVGRKSHTAVWTGTEMIVWGGYPTGGPPSGARYRPSTDSWLPVSVVNATNAAVGHTAVWTGTEMIVWGGTSDGTGGRYDPATNSWSPTSTGANAPSPRELHTAVWTGTEMIVWGGQEFATSQPTNTGGRYDPTHDAWAPTSTATNARHGHVGVWTGSRMIVSGGFGGGIAGAVYDPVGDTWIPTAGSALSQRLYASAVWTGTEMIVWGGQGVGFVDLNTGGRYDPANDRWQATSMGAGVPSGRLFHTAIWTGTEMIVWGGQSRESSSPPYLQTGGRYTPATDTWMPTSIGANVPDPRVYHSAVWTGKDMTVWGGLSLDVPTQTLVALNTGGRYDPMTDTWVPTGTGANVPPPIQKHAAVWTGKEMIVWGPKSTTAGGRYDPVTDSWRSMASGPNMNGAGAQLPSVWTGTEMIVWRGRDATGGRYNPGTNTWSPIATSPNMPPLDWGFVEVWSGTEMIVWGGCCDTNTGGRYDPSADSWTSTSTGADVASPREFATALWTGAEMLVWGGATYSPSLYPMNGGGRYDPTTDSWSPIASGPDVPSPRFDHTAVWTGTEMIVWGGRPGTATGGRYCACPSGRLVYRDADGDGYGDPAISTPSCDGVAPAGYVVDYTDCDDARPGIHPDAAEICDGLDNECDGLVDEGASGEDVDADTIHDLCDNCATTFNTTQSDTDHDGEGDACDRNDGLVFEWRADKTSVSWQDELGPDSWNVYFGDLDVLKATGVYTQQPGSNPLARRLCGETTTVADDAAEPSPGEASFSLVTGVVAGVEGSLGSSSSGARSNANPCP